MTRKLKTIRRTAAFAWSPGHQSPMIATGTKAGTVDDSFSSTSALEIFYLDLNTESKSAQSSFKVDTVSRFNALTWGHSTSDKPLGLIAGGMESGELELWDPADILDKKSATEALILRNATHTGTLCALDFNAFQSNLLASAGSNSEVYIWDLKNPSTPYSPGARSSKMDNISSVAWNCQVPHILSTASTNGYTVVWDLRNKKEVMTLAQGSHSSLTGGRGSISSISWHPNVAFQIVTASDDDQNPIISLWDLRHAHSPEKILTGHTMGVLDVSWCRQDSDLLISSGKDCKTLCWNPNTGVLNGELSNSMKWSFGVNWSPRNPDLFATSSFDGSIDIFSVHGKSNNEAIQRDDPFNTAIATAASSAKAFELKVPPKWYRRPVGATFGFSGKLVTFDNKSGQNDSSNNGDTPSQSAGVDPKIAPRCVKITTIHTDPEIVKRSEELESATYNNANNLIEDRIQNSSKDKMEWEVLKTLFSDNAREQLISYLGFEKDQVMAAATTLLENCNKADRLQEVVESGERKQNSPNAEDVNKKEDRLSTPTNTASAFFVDSPPFLEKTDDSFISQLSQEVDSGTVRDSDFGLASNPTQDFVSTNNAFKLYPEGSTENDRLITRAIMIGDFESAVNACIAIERFSDALMLAICGGGDLLARTQKIYFESQSRKYTYLRLLQGIVEDDLSAIVKEADLDEWASILVALCTYAQSSDFGPYCEVMGDRLLSSLELHDKAILFYLAAGNLEKVSSIWISQYNQDINVWDSTLNGVKLQELIEKVTIFRTAIDYEDTALVSESADYPLTDLYDKYCEYAEFMAAQGKLDVAMKYINMTPAKYSSSKTVSRTPSSIMRDRIFHASANKLGIYRRPSFPFEQTLLSSKESATNDSYNRNNTVYQPTTDNSPVPASIMQSTTNYYAPSAPTPQQQYTPYNQQNRNLQEIPADNYSTAGNYRQPQKAQIHSPYVNNHHNYPGVQNTSAAIPSPMGTGAWNDPPLFGNPIKTKKHDAPSGLNATSVTTAMPTTKKVTSPFGNSPVQNNESTSQHATVPPPQPMLARGLGCPPPPPPSSSTTIGGYYSAHQQPQQFQLQQQPFKAAPPPPPMNAIAPSPMSRESSSHQRQ